tara:strand:+ start:92 stop:319 length:228 start_codon:yes stop_codon:yes gene_type:complete
MKKLLFLIALLFITNCSLNKDSIYWNEDSINDNKDEKKLSKILKKTDDVTEMTLEEYKFYIDRMTKKGKYPDISK